MHASMLYLQMRWKEATQLFQIAKKKVSLFLQT